MAKVLVIEDDPIILENTLELLEMEGFDVIGAEDGRIGLESAQKYAPDLILCDVMMPKLDGYGVLEALRSNPATHAIPLVFVSATPREDILAASPNLEVSGCLTKPFRAHDLISMVNRLLVSPTP